MRENRNRSSSLRRALEVLSAVAAACDRNSSPNLTELAEECGINRSTVSRLLQPLLDASLVEQDGDTGRYRLGPYTARLGQIYLEHLDVRSAAALILRAMVEESLETTHLGVRDGAEVAYVDKVESPRSVRTVSKIGSRQPLYSTAMGKIMLAYSDGSVLDEVVEYGMPARTDNTITDVASLQRELQQARARGYAVDDQENECEIRCIGAPVFDHRGKVVAAISISGPATRMTMERLEELATLVRCAAAEISRRLAAPEEVLAGPAA